MKKTVSYLILVVLYNFQISAMDNKIRVEFNTKKLTGIVKLYFENSNNNQKSQEKFTFEPNKQCTEYLTLGSKLTKVTYSDNEKKLVNKYIAHGITTYLTDFIVTDNPYQRNVLFEFIKNSLFLCSWQLEVVMGSKNEWKKEPKFILETKEFAFDTTLLDRKLQFTFSIPYKNQTITQRFVVECWKKNILRELFIGAALKKLHYLYEDKWYKFNLRELKDSKTNEPVTLVISKTMNSSVKPFIKNDNLYIDGWNLKLEDKEDYIFLNLVKSLKRDLNETLY